MDERDPTLLTIGRFGRLAGLSVGALRHYDELDLLRPAWIDPDSGYRYYRPEQLDDGRTIARLRELEVPLDEIRQVLVVDDPAERRRALDRHRRRVEARSARLVRILHQLGHVVDHEESLMSKKPIVAPTLDPATSRALGAGLFNRTWELLEMPDRTPEQDDELIHTAHASRHHWAAMGEPVRLARGEWMCSRVYSTLGRAEPALWHARRCLERLEAMGSEGLEGWDLPAAYEALARASAVAGDRAAVERWSAQGRAALDGITDPEDRALIEGDLDSIPA